MKSGVLLLVPGLLQQKKSNINWTRIGTVLAGVALYHKVVRPILVAKMEQHGLGFNSGIEDLTETVLLLSMTRDTPLSSVLTQLLAIVTYHAYLRY